MQLKEVSEGQLPVITPIFPFARRVFSGTFEEGRTGGAPVLQHLPRRRRDARSEPAVPRAARRRQAAAPE
eukprot:6606005-Lingulodinium_polyedra.AAC.1